MTLPTVKGEFAPWNGKRRVRLIDDFKLKVGGKWIVVPKDFTFDGASIPQAFWSIVGSPFQQALEAGTIHDWIYFIGNPSKQEADGLFYTILRMYGMGWFKAQLFYSAVHWFGDDAWNEHRKHDKIDRKLSLWLESQRLAKIAEVDEYYTTRKAVDSARERMGR